jgi:hypothetical protein
MADDKTLQEALGRLEAAATEIKAEQTSHATLLRSIADMLGDVLEMVTPQETADPGVPLDELLARLIIELRDQGKKLDVILQLLQGSKSSSGDKAAAATPPANGSARGIRP